MPNTTSNIDKLEKVRNILRFNHSEMAEFLGCNKNTYSHWKMRTHSVSDRYLTVAWHGYNEHIKQLEKNKALVEKTLAK